MLLSEAIKKIKENNSIFEISIEGKKTFGKTRIEQAEMHAGSLEDYFKRIAKHNNVKTLAVNIYRPNGSSMVRKDFFIVDIPAVVDATNIVDSATNNVDEQQQQKPTKQSDMSNVTRADIDAATLKVENQFLKKDVDTLTERVKKLEVKEDRLLNENRDLLRENATIKDKADLELKTKMHEVAAASKDGLSGILDTVEKNPDLIKALVGFFPNHPMNKLLNNSEETEEINGVEQHDDADAQTCIDDIIIPSLNKLGSEEVGMISIIIEHLSKNEKALVNLYNAVTKPKAEKTESKPN